ncbi:DEAD/DEAH box helicase [Desulfovibrio intestinalis]|uniref:DEAD-box ATP-dependent RNA helicase RhpA n=1 Tax=Desulfovibrio intestinalis TaxID=58621 RepID=A0A7W8FFY0_9BACT|nr:DEAD/DEAH box helicase [Desulfovibrio intestinalis]MBB5142247.1 ATP-dependent RNA helicase DeaD [Desulfovibrio intestinalis]
MTASFEDLGLSRELLKAVEDLGFEEPSPIQVLAIPALLAGRDALGQAQTGTGKTAAFGLPLLEKLTNAKHVQALVLCPTRELAIQVAEELNKLAARKRGVAILPIYGGQPIERQLRALDKGVQIVVGTPGRVMDHMKRGTLKLNSITAAVLDEADEMLDMGFREDIEAILEQTPANCQRVLFSATVPGPIRELCKRFLRDPEMLTVAQKMLTVPAIEQVYYEVRPHQKMDALCRLLDSQGFRKALVFCSTKRSVDEVTLHLQQRGYQADGLHGNLAQSQRDRVMQRFRTDGLDVLVATDVAARGLDVDDVDAVVNYDIPHDVEKYVHRIGRTGRAGRVGSAFTFVTMREHYKMRDIIRFTKARITEGRLPSLRDVDSIRTSRLLDEVRQTLEGGPLERWLVLVEEFLAAQFPDGEVTNRDVSAALLKLLMQRDFGDQDKASEQDPLSMPPRRPANEGSFDRRDAGRSGAKPQRRENDGPMTKLHVNVGHMNKVSPRELVGAITGETGISSRHIGAISIQKGFSLVEISSDMAEDVMSVLNRGVFIAGTRVAAKMDSGRPGTPRPRKPGAPGARRQPPARYGKKPRGFLGDNDD